jgi:hypothetical protein
MSLDALAAKGRYAELVAAIDKLDAAVGGDPFLDFQRAAVAVKRNDLPAANRLLDWVIAAEPTLSMPYFNRIDLALKAKDYATVARLLTAAEQYAGVRWDSFEKVPIYADFLKSPEYAKWSRQHAARPATVPTTRPAAKADQ